DGSASVEPLVQDRSSNLCWFLLYQSMISALLNGQQSRQHPAVIECFNLVMSRRKPNLPDR
ncbi:MAG: hypothetical protein AB1Z31_19095, partial [Desulfobacterales bacterium]